MTPNQTCDAIHALAQICHIANYHWWRDLKTGELLFDNPHVIASKLLLIHSEISEAAEGHRKNLMDSHLPTRKSIEVELADAMIRILDLAGALRLDIGEAFVEKMQYNATRADHTDAHRLGTGGKAY